MKVLCAVTPLVKLKIVHYNWLSQSRAGNLANAKRGTHCSVHEKEMLTTELEVAAEVEFDSGYGTK